MRPGLRYLALPLIAAVIGFGVCDRSIAAPGDLDSTFGQYGVTRIAFTPTDDFSVGSAVGVQPSGKPVLAGAAMTIWSDRTNSDIYTTFAASRLDEDGTLDPSFGTEGIRVGGLGFGADDLNSDLLAAGLAKDGSIVVGQPFEVARLNPDGSLDPGFGEGGVATDPDKRFGVHPDLGVLSDGSIVLAQEESWSQRIILLKFTPEGVRDYTFGVGGEVSTAPQPHRSIDDLLVDGKDRILIAETSWEGDAQDHSVLTVARLSPDGEPDPSFGADGTKLIGEKSRFNESATLAVDDRNRIYVLSAGTLTRVKEDGSIDASFGDDGKVALPAGVRTGTVHPDGDGVFVAATGDVLGLMPLVVGHLLSNGKGDPDFARAGWSSTYHTDVLSPYFPSSVPPSVAMVSPERLTVVAPGESMLVMRYRLDGGGPRDSDGDGVNDEQDACPERSWSYPGCPRYESSIGTLEWAPEARPDHRPGVFGWFSSEQAYCNREIRLVTAKEHKLIGKDVPGRSGRFFVPVRPRTTGRVFAVARMKKDARLGYCLRSRSPFYPLPKGR